MSYIPRNLPPLPTPHPSLFAYVVALDAMPVPTRYLNVPNLPNSQASMVFAQR